MTVRELIDLLEEQDPEAEVLIMSQEKWPFENAVYGLTSRAALTGADAEDDDGAPAAPPRPDDGAPSDVFIVEGRQLRYGSKTAWDIAAR